MSDTGLFAKESAPYAPFKTVGTEYSGIIVHAGKMQQTTYVPKHQREAGKQGEPLWWEKPSAANPAGRPKWVVIVTLQTDLRDPNIPGDDGRRSLWIKGKRMEDAAQKAVNEAGASAVGLIEGGWFRMKLTHEVPNAEEGLNPTKFYEATYRPPARSAHTEILAGPAADDPWGTTPPAATTPTTQEMLEKLLREQQGDNR